MVAKCIIKMALLIFSSEVSPCCWWTSSLNVLEGINQQDCWIKQVSKAHVCLRAVCVSSALELSPRLLIDISHQVHRFFFLDVQFAYMFPNLILLHWGQIFLTCLVGLGSLKACVTREVQGRGGIWYFGLLVPFIMSPSPLSSRTKGIPFAAMYV